MCLFVGWNFFKLKAGEKSPVSSHWPCPPHYHADPACCSPLLLLTGQGLSAPPRARPPRAAEGSVFSLNQNLPFCRKLSLSPEMQSRCLTPPKSVPPCLPSSPPAPAPHSTPASVCSSVWPLVPQISTWLSFLSIHTSTQCHLHQEARPAHSYLNSFPIPTQTLSWTPLNSLLGDCFLSLLLGCNKPQSRDCLFDTVSLALSTKPNTQQGHSRYLLAQ